MVIQLEINMRDKTTKRKVSASTIDPGDDEQWGKLVKTWATGTDYIKNKYAYPRPDTKPDPITEFNEQVKHCGADFELPPYIKSIVFIQPTKDVLIIKLPPKEMILESEKFLKDPGNDYGLPRFYGPIFGKPSKPGIKDIKERLRLHAMRIGDYTIRICM